MDISLYGITMQSARRRICNKSFYSRGSRVLIKPFTLKVIYSFTFNFKILTSGLFSHSFIQCLQGVHIPFLVTILDVNRCSEKQPFFVNKCAFSKTKCTRLLFLTILGSNLDRILTLRRLLDKNKETHKPTYTIYKILLYGLPN